MTFLKNDPRPCATLKQLFLDRFELIVAHFGPPKIPKCLENGLFWDQKWVKNGSKTHFSKPHPRPFGVHKRMKWAHLEPILGHFGPSAHRIKPYLGFGVPVGSAYLSARRTFGRPSRPAEGTV